ncbi:hypothetical protein [Flexibacterium corallicola]|uniref:hypothetical protein n=1 Tax=Flexibacterium corallicola TaxID=3037259 RepID=UPI00286F2924|nr:hypothetical protein [Pseudovibrio sp. M1P-2-3]
MNNLRKLAAMGALFALSNPAFAMEPATGEFSLKLGTVFAVSKSGQPAMAFDKACKEKFANMVGQEAQAKYQIDPQVMEAQLTFLGVPTKLYPMGIQGRHDYISGDVAEPLVKKGVFREILHMNMDFTTKDISVMTALDQKINCVITNRHPEQR